MSASVLDRPSCTASTAEAQRRPFGAYAGVAGVFGLVAAGLVAAVASKPRRQQQPLGLGDLLLFGVATYRASRLLTKDIVTSFVRAPFVTFLGVADAPYELDQKPRGEGLRRAIGEMLECPYCADAWIATGLVAGKFLAPRLTRAAASVFVVEAIADGLNMAHAGAWHRLSRQ